MNSKTAEKTIVIDATVSDVWKAITDPEMIKQYFSYTDVDSEWQEGSPIVYTGIWEGRAYKDKGIILEIKKEKKLHHTHWSSLSGTPDIPENYLTISYQLEATGAQTTLTIVQTVRQNAAHFARQWDSVLEKLKELLEKIN